MSSMSTVFAAEGEDIDNMRQVYSQEEYLQYELSWNAEDGFNWDLLSEVKMEGELVASYGYDDNFNRSIKVVGGEETLFTYSDDNRILAVEDKEGIITYNYEYHEELDEYDLLGFDYNGKRYWFDYSNGIIEGISDDSGMVAGYEYGDDCGFVATYKYVDGELVLNADEDFIGNINGLRYNASYYDKETGWYYKRRYYDPKEVRYVDGISYEEAMEEFEKAEPENKASILTRIYSWGVYSTPAGLQAARAGRAELSDDAKKDVIARTLNAEAGTSEADWYAVAWVVYNRVAVRFNNKDTAYAVITDGDQFSAYYEQSEEYRNPDTTSARWAVCAVNAQSLFNNQTPVQGKPAYINNQLFFRSVASFIDGYADYGSDSTYGGNNSYICDIAVPGYGSIVEGTPAYTIANVYGRYAGVFNIYFNYK